MTDYYAILGVSPECTDNDLRIAYRRLAMQHHPDRGGLHEDMIKLNEAFSILSNPITRSRYDQARNFPSRMNWPEDLRRDVENARNSAEEYPRKWDGFIKWFEQFTSDWRNSDNWKIHFRSGVCPKCGTIAPARRIPASVREALWGGWTCRKCGCAFDKVGRPR